MQRFFPLLAPCCLPAALGMASLVSPQPLFLVNTSPSEPEGVYVRSALPPGPGRLAAFHVPAPGRAYATAFLPQIGSGGILKMLVAGTGARVCAEGAVLSADGLALGQISAKDRRGRPLPRWRGCRVLGEGEFLAFSDRIPNSFDSRYYGPVSSRDLIGAYEPLWIWS